MVVGVAKHNPRWRRVESFLVKWRFDPPVAFKGEDMALSNRQHLRLVRIRTLITPAIAAHYRGGCAPERLAELIRELVKPNARPYVDSILQSWAKRSIDANMGKFLADTAKALDWGTT